MAQKKGVKVLVGSVLEIDSETAGHRNIGVKFVDEHDGKTSTLSARDIVVAAGSWSSRILPSVSIGGAKSHSIVMRPSRSLSADMLFLTIRPGPDGSTGYITPEAYPRPDGTL